ncbi:beta-ketoacyl synthase N-terminal-like domain-containing protein [Chitinophaga sp.]|uniref:beta-ketoacyl synthase N-terminal-like domain-containing protein n=1 Tax=Chitinophaga sp. TaxID=1869181 RepID=UPI0031CEA9D2
MVAITGISFELPGINSWRELIASLGSNETFIGEMPLGRLRDIQHRFGNVEMAHAGFMQRVDLFDNEYFNLSRREAVKMSPEQRLFLTHAVRAFYDAGYGAAAIRGSDTGIFYTTGKSGYDTFWDEPLGEFDALGGIEGTRLAHLMDLRGPAMAINTSCSSSLVAVDSAILSLQAGQCDMALVGGVKIAALPRHVAARSTVMSKQQQCRPFDDAADGLMNGEGVICIVLKRLTDAERDGDPVYAVINGSAVNHGGARIASLTAPSAKAQQEVILKAWKRAGIDPAGIKYVEAHGTGTILGDPIEYTGLKDAFAAGGACAISSFKGQIGHLDTLSGLAGLLRLVAAMNAGVIPVQPNFNTLNRHIDYDDRLVKVQTTVQQWESVNGRKVGGVSSFGLTGTNVHIVLSKKDPIEEAVPDSGWHFLQLSELNAERLEGLKLYIGEVLNQLLPAQLGDFCNKVNRLYQPAQVSQGFVFSSAESLKAQLDEKAKVPEKTVWYILDLALLKYDKEEVLHIFKENKLIRQYVEADNPLLNVLFQYALYQYLIAALGDQVKFITRKGEGVLDRLIQKKLTVADLIAQPELATEGAAAFNETAFGEFIESRNGYDKVILVDFSDGDVQRFSHLKLELKVISGKLDAFNRFTLYGELLAAGKEALRGGINPLFTSLQLPYFNLKRFWPESKQLNAVTARVSEVVAVVDIAQVKDTIREMWCKILETAVIGDLDDFFELGGDSLVALEMIRGVERQYQGVKFSYEDMYDLATIETISQAVVTQLQNKLQGSEKKEPVKAQILSGKDRYLSLVAATGEEALNRVVPDKILITGATGLVGGFLTAYLYRHTQSTLYCLVRSRDEVAAHKRFWDIFSSNFGIPENDRIQVVEGDLLQPGLGIHVDDVQAVYHVAGSPAFASKVKPEEHINYIGTRHCVEWSNTQGVTSFNLISTIGIVGKTMPDHITDFYETDQDVGQHTASLIHASSKLLAEGYVRSHFRGDARVFRLPNVGGRFKDGFITTDVSRNLMYLRIKALADLGCYSDEIGVLSSGISLLPVDILAAMIAEISFAGSSVLQTYHLNTVSPFTIGELVQAFENNGIYLKRLEQTEMLNRIESYRKDAGMNLFNIGKVGAGENSYVFHNEASLRLIEKLKIPGVINYERQQYLNNILKFCMVNNSLNLQITEKEPI